MPAWQRSVQSIENTVKHVVTTLVIAPSLASRPPRSHSTSSHLTSLGFLAHAVRPPLHTFVRILNSKHNTNTAFVKQLWLHTYGDGFLPKVLFSYKCHSWH